MVSDESEVMHQHGVDNAVMRQPQSSHSPFLSLPPELRHQIYVYLFSSAPDLVIRSLFIRAHYRNVFMTQQVKDLGPSILRVCRQITRETLPLLYASPRWVCNCRIEALAVQIGYANFGRIRKMQVDVDDLDLVVECSIRKRRGSRTAEYAMQSLAVKVPDSIRGSYDEWGKYLGVLASQALDFSNLEVLEVEGYQSAALSSRGTHRVRVEALRLCELAMQLLDFHPRLNYLLQKRSRSDGGGDARDLTLGRVRWRFVKELPTIDVRVSGGDDLGEHVVDLVQLRSTLELILREDERAIESSLPVAWTSSETGRFHLYPFLLANE